MEVLSRGGDGRRTGLQRQFEFKINRHVPNLAGRQTACVVVETVVCRAVALRGTLATWRKWLLGKGVVPRRAQLAPPGETFGLAHRSRKFPRRAEECTPSRTGPCRCSMIDCAFPCPCHCCILIVLSSIFEHKRNEPAGGGRTRQTQQFPSSQEPTVTFQTFNFAFTVLAPTLRGTAPCWPDMLRASSFSCPCPSQDSIP